MALSNLESLVGKVQQRVGPSADYYLVVDALVNGAREIYRDRDWTFKRRRGQFIFHAPYTTGTATVARGTNVVDFSGAVILDTHVGRQLRVGGNETPIVTITRRVSATRVEIDQEWGAAAQTAAGFEIYSALLSMPSDFDSFVSIVDLQRKFQINWWTYSADDLDRVDPGRSYGGDMAYAVVLRDYAGDATGVVGPVIQARGTGNRPRSGGTYNGVSDAVFTVEMTSVTAFKWRKDGGVYTTGVTIDPDGIEQHLQDGVTVSFPTGVSYTSGDVFVVPAKAASNAGSPRYEAWPHIKADETRPYLYNARMVDLDEPGAVLPRGIPSDLVVEKALAAIARWRSEDNPYYDLKLSVLHEERANVLMVDVIREDEAKETTMVAYDEWSSWPPYDSAYLAGHDAGYEIDVL